MSVKLADTHCNRERTAHHCFCPNNVVPYPFFFLFKDWGFGEAIHLYSNLECLKDLVSELRRGMEWMLNDKKPFMNLL